MDHVLLLIAYFMITASLLSSVTAECSRSTPPCNLVCHCSSSSICSETGCSSGGCSTGWDGPTCQRENIVLGFHNDSSLGSSGDQGNHYPALAFDGNQITYFRSDFQQDPHLWVNLGSVQTVYALSVLTTVHDFQIDVLHYSQSGTRSANCMSNNAQTSTTETRYDVTCNQPLDGQLVWISLSGYRTLDVTEMEIYRCSDFWYGVQCDKPCNCKIRTEVCDKVTGQCYSGCPTKFDGYDCQDCIDGRYGVGCSNVCGNCYNNQVCDKDNGHCPSGCKDGYTSDRCIDPKIEPPDVPSVSVGYIVAVVLCVLLAVTIGVFCMKSRWIKMYYLHGKWRL